MDPEDFITATQIRLKQKQINRMLATLATNKIDQDLLLQIYTVLGNADEYEEYVGKLYVTPPAVTFEGGGGADAAATAIIIAGVLTAVDMTDPGHDYTSVPDVIFTGGGGKGAAAHALLSGSGDTVASVVVDNMSLVSRLMNENFDLDDQFAGL